MQVLDAEDKRYLTEKYGFTTPDFVNVVRKMRAGFSIMKAAKLVNENKSNTPHRGEGAEQPIA